MTITTNTGFDNAAAAPVYGALLFVECQFVSATQYLTNYPVDLTALTHTWTGIGVGLSMGEMRESEDGQSQKTDLILSIKAAYVSLAMGNVGEYIGRTVRVWLALTDGAGVIQGTPVLRFAGTMGPIRIEREGEDAKVIIELESGSYNQRINPAGLRANHAQHQARHPGELGFERQATLIGKPATWLSARFQRV